MRRATREFSRRYSSMSFRTKGVKDTDFAKQELKFKGTDVPSFLNEITALKKQKEICFSGCKALFNSIQAQFTPDDYQTSFGLSVTLDEFERLLWTKFTMRQAREMHPIVEKFRNKLRRELKKTANKRVDELYDFYQGKSERQLLDIIQEKKQLQSLGTFHLDNEHHRTAARLVLHPDLSSIVIFDRGYNAYYNAKEFSKHGLQTIIIASTFDSRKHFLAPADKVRYVHTLRYYEEECKAILAELQEKSHPKERFAIDPAGGPFSENAYFSRMVSKMDMTFLGPDPYALAQFRSKNIAKNVAKSINLSPVPSIETVVGDKLDDQADELGFPVMLKNIQGSDNQQTRLVKNKTELEMARQAIKGEVILEKYIAGEKLTQGLLMIATDGMAILGCQDCSWQIDGQRSLVEAMADIKGKESWRLKMLKIMTAAKRHGYRGALTAEFLGPYFLEFNTCKPSELHATELTLGNYISISELQRQIFATGKMMPYLKKQLESLGINSRNLTAQGIIDILHEISTVKYCIQAPLDAVRMENVNGHLLFTGTVGNAKPLHQSEFGKDNKMISSVEFSERVNTKGKGELINSTIAQVYGTGQNRESARLALLEAVNKELMGKDLPTNLPYYRAVLQHPAFINGPNTDSSIKMNEEFLAEVDNMSHSASLN